jgi:hypothetical protein
MPQHTEGKGTGKLSRRDFARGVALAAGTAAFPTTASVRAYGLAQEAGGQASQLPPAGEVQVQAIFAKYGKRLSDEQKTDVKRLAALARKTSDTLRSFPLENSDEPAMTFHVYRSDR